MSLHRVSAARVIPAPAVRVYDLLADYREGHPSILPKPEFISLTVEQGGRGAGTVESLDEGWQAEVTITTDTQVRDGITGKVEGWMTTRLLRPIYVKELEQLATVMSK